MRRLMLGMSQTKLADALGLTFQQVQKYEKGINRIGASRLLHIAHLLQIPVAFLFEGGPRLSVGSKGIVTTRPIVHYGHFLATSDGLALSKSFMRIKDGNLRRSVVKLVEQISGDRKEWL